MALDTTVGGTASDSYCTLAEANTYHTTRAYNGEWTAASDANKELYLKWATRRIDAHFRFIGTKSTSQQALSWPRYGVVDLDNYWVSSTVIPAAVKNAEAELAWQMMKEDWSQGLGSVVDEGVSVGSIKTSMERHRPMPSSVLELLSLFINGGTGAIASVPMVRG